MIVIEGKNDVKSSGFPNTFDDVSEEALSEL